MMDAVGSSAPSFEAANASYPPPPLGGREGGLPEIVPFHTWRRARNGTIEPIKKIDWVPIKERDATHVSRGAKNEG